MPQTVDNARGVIGTILQSMRITKVVSVDDVYALQSDGYNEVLTALEVARTEGTTPVWIDEIPKGIVHAPEEIMRARLAEYWEGLHPSKRRSLKDLTEVGKGAQDARDLSLLGQLMPDSILFECFTPRQWEQNAESIVAGAHDEARILVMFDQDLSLDGLPSDGGIILLQRTIQMRNDRPVIVGLLSQVWNYDEEREKLVELATQAGVERNQFWPLSKQRLRDEPLDFACGIKLICLAHVQQSLTELVLSMSQEASTKAGEDLRNLDVMDFYQVVVRSSEHEGLWEPETLFRVFEDFRASAFRKSAYGSNKSALNLRIGETRSVCAIKAAQIESASPTRRVYEIQRDEQFEWDFVNISLLPVELGDIFAIDGDEYWVLVGQPCDLAVRSDGKRNAQFGTLVNIMTFPEKQSLDPVTNFHIRYFSENPTDFSYVKFRDTIQVGMDILDLAALNPDGQCKIDLSASQASTPRIPGEPFERLHNSWKKRLRRVARTLLEYRHELEEYVGMPENTRDAIRCKLLRVDSKITFSYTAQGIYSFGLRRIGRYRVPGATRLLHKYSAFLTRPAEPHDLFVWGS